MKPKIYEKIVSAGDNNAEKIISCISNFDCSLFFGNHIGKSQPEQKNIVSGFQKSICDELSKDVSAIAWELEYSPNIERRDSVDIYGKNGGSSVIIEIDKPRADQVAKKFLSRNALFIDKRMLYISLCYPGTSSMNSCECVKYFGYCKQLSQRMGNEYAGFIIE